MASLPMASGNQDLSRFSINWIVSRQADLLWFIGGALAGYGMFFLHAGLRLDMVTVWFIWVIFLDSPHFFGTYLRTYFDREEWQNRRPLLIGSLAWFLVGPAMIGLSYLLYQLQFANYTLPFFLFVLFFNLWAYWHVVRQHFGILSLYKRKNQDFDLPDTRVDKALLYVGLLAPFLAYILRHPEAREAIGLSSALPAYPLLSGPAALFSADYLRALHWEHYLIGLSVLALATVSGAFVVRQYQRWRRQLPLNLPKILFLAALIPLYAFICYSPAVLTAPLIAFSAFVTIYHDIQYHAIVWFYSRNRYHRPGVDQNQYGMAVKLSRNIFVYLGSGILMAAIFRLFGCSFEIHPGCGPLVLSSEQILFGGMTSRELLLTLLLGLPLHHYFIDQYIWRPSKDKGLQQDLKLKNS